MHNPENSYIKNIDENTAPHQEYTPGLGFDAEDVVLDFLNNNFEGITVRHSSHSEDSGVKQIQKGKQIDAVAYMGDETAMCLQITTARDPNIQKEKLAQLRDHPFVRLDEMDPKETAIPKVLIGLDPSEVSSFLKDHDFSQHPKIAEKIVKDIVNSLKFDLMKTVNSKEQEKTKRLLALFESSKLH